MGYGWRRGSVMYPIRSSPSNQKNMLKKLKKEKKQYWGDLSGVRGNLSGVRGDLTGVRGDLTGVRGNLDECQITDEDRKNGIDIEDLTNN